MREKRISIFIILGVLIVSLAISIGIIIDKKYKLQKEEEYYSDLAQYKNTEVTAPNEEKEEVIEKEIAEEIAEEDVSLEEESTTYVSEIDFDALQTNENEDIYAWIKVEGTVIDYPILQHPTDDSFYLTHNIDGSIGYPGCIYSEHYNHKDFNDRVTVLYGHNMRDGSMFAGLHKFKDRSFFEDHDTIEICLPSEKKVYKIISAFYTNDRRITTYYRTMTEEGANNWIGTLRDVTETDRDHKRDVEYSNNDTFLVLETCVGKDKEHRLVVVGVEEKQVIKK